MNQTNTPMAPTQLDHLEMPAPTADILARIRYLQRLSRYTQAEFGRKVNIDPANLSRILSGKIPVTDSFVNKLVVNLGVSKQWLTDGTDVPFPRVSEPERPAVTPGAPVYDIDVTAGCMPLSRMFTEERIIGYFNLPGVNPKYPLVRVTGNSMAPTINHGCYIAIRPINNISTIAWGQIYVVVLEDYRLVKYIRRNRDDNFVTLHSANPDYDDMEVRRSDIRGLFLVESIFNYDIVS